MKTLRNTESSRKITRGLLWGFVALVAGTLIAGFLVPGEWSAFILGLGAAVIIMAITAFTTKKMADSTDWVVGWVALDYVVKIVTIAAAILSAKYIFELNIRVVGFVIIAAVCITLLAQIAILLNRSPRPLS